MHIVQRVPPPSIFLVAQPSVQPLVSHFPRIQVWAGVLVGLGILGPPASSRAGAWEVPAPAPLGSLIGTGQAGAARTIRDWAGLLAYSDMAGGRGHGSREGPI